MNQKQRLRAAIDDLYRDPSDRTPLEEAWRVLGEVQKGQADGSIGYELWTRRRDLVTAFQTIQEERQTLDETEDM